MLLPHERHSMHEIQLVSVDLFNTLVDLSTGRHTLWHTFLGESSTPARVEQAWTLTTQMLFTALDQLNVTATYQSLHAVFQACYTEVFTRLYITFDPEEAARVAARYHAQCPWFPEAVPWLEDIRRRYRLCVASDADEAMVGEHVRRYPFDRCLTSESLRVYKGDAQNRFFAAIVAAQRVGLQTCWVNRSGRSWPYECPPTYEVSSLAALGALLEETPWP